jgi:hypothetical protein
LTKEEEVLSWTSTIETLEKVYKDFYSYKDFPKGKFNPNPVWLYEGNYKNEDKATCKKEVMRILNLCKKEYILINSPAIANLIYNNRLSERKVKKENMVTLQEKIVNKPIAPQDLAKNDRLIERDFVEKEEIVSAAQQKSDSPSTNILTAQLSDCDKMDLKSGKETTDKTAEQKWKEGLDALREYLQAGIGLIGAYDNGATIAKGDKYDKAFTCDIGVIENLWEGKDQRTNGKKIRRYYFRPKDSGLVCLDIDCKNGKNGLRDFYDCFCKSVGKTQELLPTTLQDLPNNFPCWSETPNGGYHLYFKNDGEVKIAHLPKAPCVEVKSKQLTAAGSFKDGKPYVLHGSISAAPRLPKFIASAVSKMEIAKKETVNIKVLPQKQKSGRDKTYIKKDWGKPSWEQITKWAEEDNPFEIAAGRNRRATYLAFCAKRHGYTANETLPELYNDTTVNSLPTSEINSIIKSVYKRS